MLSKLSHDGDSEVAQGAIMALGLVGAGTNNSRIALLLRQLSTVRQRHVYGLRKHSCLRRNVASVGMSDWIFKIKDMTHEVVMRIGLAIVEFIDTDVSVLFGALF